MSNENKNEPQTENRHNRAQAQERQAGAIVVELGSEERNTNPFLRVAGEAFRGITRLSNASINERTTPENNGVPDMPGFYVEIDVRKRRVSLYDPLTKPRFARTRERLEKHLQSPPKQGTPRRTFQPVKERVTENCSNEVIVAWLKELYVMCQEGAAQLRDGEFPKEIPEAVDSQSKYQWSLQKPADAPIPQLVG